MALKPASGRGQRAAQETDEKAGEFFALGQASSALSEGIDEGIEQKVMLAIEESCNEQVAQPP